jgi:hypothetical protein
MSEEDASFSLPSAARAMAQRDSAKVEAQFQDVRPFPSPLIHVDLDLVKLTELALCAIDGLPRRHHGRQAEHAAERI